MTPRLTEHFTLEELTRSTTAERLAMDNTPPEGIVRALGVLALGLESVRSLLGVPLHIDSGYRCPALNAYVGGAKNSAHLSGYAADFIAPAFGSPLVIAHRLMESGISFDQLIQEGSWVHISFAPALRQRILTAHFGPGGATYSNGA